MDLSSPEVDLYLKTPRLSLLKFGVSLSEVDLSSPEVDLDLKAPELSICQWLRVPITDAFFDFQNHPTVCSHTYIFQLFRFFRFSENPTVCSHTYTG